MYLTSTAKSIVFTVAFATQCVYAKLRNEYGYFDEKFCVFEWITYLKRLSLIALMLCGAVLYYVPKSRSYARRTCCILINIIANGLKSALNANETEYERIRARDENDQNKELRIQELYRKVYKEDTKDCEQKYINVPNFDNNDHKSIRKHKSQKFHIKHAVKGKQTQKRHRHDRHYRNATNNILSEPNVVMTVNSPQQITTIDEKCEKDNVVDLQNTSPNTKITTCTMSADKLKNSINSQQKNSLNMKTDSSAVSEINHKNNTKKFEIPSRRQENMSDIDTDKKLQNIQNFDMKHEEITIVSQGQSSKDCATRILNEQINLYYEKLFTKRELHDGFRRENHRFLHDMKSFIQDRYENSSITKYYHWAKPVLLRVVNWFFGGCPEASRRHRD